MQSLTGQLLIAMPQMEDPRFARSLVYLFAHSEEDGAMGIIVNKIIADLSEDQLYAELKFAPAATPPPAQPVHFGGPVQPGLGFVLHSLDYRETGTAEIAEGFGLTTTLGILSAMSRGEGPRQRILALGYAGWGPAQLEAEIQANGWLLVAADTQLVFDADDGSKWSRALAKLGVKPEMLSGGAGRA
jgi:putative transcriptional regulator